MKRQILITLITILSFTNIYAQFGMPKAEDANKIQKRTLLVVLDEVDERLKKKINKKPEKFQKYADEINLYNENLKSAIENTWTFSTEIRYVTQTKFLEIKKDKKQKKLYAYFSNKIQRNPSRIISDSYYADAPDIYTINIGLADEKKAIHSMMYSTSHPSEADLTFISQQFQNLLTSLQQAEGKKYRKEMKATMAKNSQKLKTKTLLLDKEFVDKKLISKIDKIYKYDYKLTDRETIDKAILAKDSKYAYVRAFPMFQQNGGNKSILKVSKLIYIQYVIDAENGEIASYAAPASIGLGGNLATAAKSSNQSTSVKDLEKIVKMIN
ncbi:hypothetical protein [Lacinutrix mariniflava]|uniref:hypothetical protein n=1 Tax=Lacinutrix mariniflava TaxID=342955 RepID=UPI0006E3497E|nr:hypothetical protein [Lacinutrix mariniflava]